MHLHLLFYTRGNKEQDKGEDAEGKPLEVTLKEAPYGCKDHEPAKDRVHYECLFVEGNSFFQMVYFSSNIHKIILT